MSHLIFSQNLRIVFCRMGQTLEQATNLTKLIHLFTLQNTQHLYKVTESVCIYTYGLWSVSMCTCMFVLIGCHSCSPTCGYVFTGCVSFSDTFSMEQSPSWEANQFSAFYGTQTFITVFTRPATCPYPQPDQSSPCFPIPLPEDSFY
jgi:hypothetical protein